MIQMNKEQELNNISGKERLLNIIEIIKKHDILSGITPEKLRVLFSDLGPTYIKIGQILSNRPDLLPKEYIEELSKLRSDVLPMPYQEILDILREEYDKKIFQIFLSIERNPIGSASIAQVHKATLKNGKKVVIKVQRRNIKETMIADIKVLKKAIQMLRIEKILKNTIPLNDILDELLITSLEEMNFITESEHINEFYKINKELKYIKIPKVYKSLTTEKVLVMEYVEGDKISNHESLIDKGYDLNEIGEKLADNYIYQAVDVGYFHADPHPDNIIIHEGKITYVDFGMMGHLNSRNKELLKRCIIAILNDDIKEVERTLLIICETKGNINHSRLCNELQSILDKYKTTEIKDINIAKFTEELMTMLTTNNITIPKDITMLVRGIVVLEGTLEVVSPDINLMQVFKNHLKHYNIKSLISKENITKEAGHFLTSLGSLSRIPSDIHSLFKELSRGETKINIEISDGKTYLDRLEKMIHRIVVCFLDVAFILGAALMVSNGIHTSDQRFLFYLYVTVGFIFTIWIFIKMYLDKLNRKK